MERKSITKGRSEEKIRRQNSIYSKNYTNAKCYNPGNMGHIYPNCLDKIKEESGNAQSTTAILSTITNETDAVEGEHHVHIGGWKGQKQ